MSETLARKAQLICEQISEKMGGAKVNWSRQAKTFYNRGASDENGAIEARQRSIKHFIEQALLLRGSRQFDTLDNYREFIAAVAARANARVPGYIIGESAMQVSRRLLKPLCVWQNLALGGSPSQ